MPSQTLEQKIQATIGVVWFVAMCTYNSTGKFTEKEEKQRREDAIVNGAKIIMAKIKANHKLKGEASQ